MKKVYKVVCVIAVDSNGDVASGVSSANDLTTSMEEARTAATENYGAEVGEEDLPRRYVTLIMEVPAPVENNVTFNLTIPVQETNEPVKLRVV